MEHPENNEAYKGLTVNKGIEQPSVVNPYLKLRKKPQRRQYTAAEYVEGIVKGDITVLSQAVTLVESLKPEHQVLAQEVIEKCLPYSGNSVRIGISGVPGAGKSTSIDVFGLHVLQQYGGKLAVLAIDPSSERSKGSILGDKTRMEKLSVHPDSFIRPSPAAGSLGGVARKTRETIILCEAAGFDKIFVETVGVGQSETAVHSMVIWFTDILTLYVPTVISSTGGMSRPSIGCTKPSTNTCVTVSTRTRPLLPNFRFVNRKCWEVWPLRLQRPRNCWMLISMN